MRGNADISKGFGGGTAGKGMFGVFRQFVGDVKMLFQRFADGI